MKCPLKSIYKIIFVIFLLLLFSSSIYAKKDSSTHQDVEAVVDLSVCGDGIAEEPEDCDGQDLNNETCGSLRYRNGELSCDIACEFDLASCSGTLSTLTPTPTSTTESTSQTSSSNSSDQSNNGKSQINFVKEILRQIDSKLKTIQLRFDFDSSGKVEVYELYNTVKTWVDDWKINIEVETAYAKGEIIEDKLVRPEKCDLNNDNVCNVIDLSILLYYIER